MGAGGRVDGRVTIGNRINLVLRELFARQRCHLVANYTQGFSALAITTRSFLFMHSDSHSDSDLDSDSHILLTSHCGNVTFIGLSFARFSLPAFPAFPFVAVATLIAKTFRLLFMAFIVLFIQLVMPFVFYKALSEYTLRCHLYLSRLCSSLSSSSSSWPEFFGSALYTALLGRDSRISRSVCLTRLDAYLNDCLWSDYECWRLLA